MKSQTKTSKTGSGPSNFKHFVVASILIHMSLFALLFLFAKNESLKARPQIIEITFSDTNIEKQKIINPNLIVESDSAMANNQLADDAKFLSEKSNTVKKETRAKFGEKFHNARKNSQKLKAQKEMHKQNDRPKLFDNGFNAYASLNKKDSFEQKKQLGGNLGDSSTTNDSLAQIEEDLITRLNTKEYKYYGYYSRIKKQLNQWWVPKVQQKFTKMMRKGRSLASEENKVTKLVIILNGVGHLVTVQVLAESGVRDLDDAAIEAFRQAAPFPNPPKGMIEHDGTVKIRWDCVVEG